jgi:hypothetical protein
VLESRRTVTQGDQGQRGAKKRRTFAQVLESRRTVIQGDLSKGEEGLSSRDQVQRRKVQRCSKEKKTQQPEIEGQISGVR